MLYALVIYIVSVAVPARKNYLQSSKIAIWVKAIHLIITSILFIYYFNNFRVMLWNLYRNGVNGFYTIKGIYAFSKSTDLIIAVSFFMVSFFVSGLALNLAVRAKSRKLLLLSSPIIIVATSFDLYKFAIVESLSAKDNLFLLVTISYLTLFFSLINLFYNIKPGKNIFKVSDS
ncbi:hypothetical protein LA303_08870 [Candidatus Sulfidibacterium hydrothermale]|uniref:hypothetical protein n=1 Tax=Candidatus Sulfidibacterium hydrothermale TaxID=2875962 RepID=UPI001F0A6E3A|nr:hypothetical protein [Candidatus Sulfidibacterium hydrothermale]UBM61527.1 hypothetical protein LA303_08870 [Candidatus Sulfidibacterium hydrothermale]